MTAGVTRQTLPHIHDHVEYWPHQLEGIRKMATMGSFILADEMGLGKSLQALTVADIDFKRGWAERILIIAPVSLKWNWEEEVRKFTVFSYRLVDGNPSERARILEEFYDFGIQVLIMNYEQVLAHLEEVNRIGFQIVIYDEAHYFKNYKAKRTEAVHGIRADRHFLLTGSPLLNQVNELWALLHRINPTRFPDYWRFVNRYCVFGGYKGKQIVGVKNKEELQNIIDQVMIRRLARNVLRLEEPQIIQVPVDLSPLQRRLYDQAKDDLEIEVPDADNIELDNPLHRYLKLKQICGTTRTIPGHPDDSIKLDVAVDMAVQMLTPQPDAPSEPIVIFTQFRDVLDCLVQRLGQKGVTTFVLHGDVPQADRFATIQAWSAFHDKNQQAAVLGVMLQVGGIGYTMTAASRCIFLDKLYVPKLNEQAIARLNRIGQQKTVQVYEIIARKTVEQRIETILKRKKKLFDTLIEEDDWLAMLHQALQSDDDEGDEE